MWLRQYKTSYALTLVIGIALLGFLVPRTMRSADETSWPIYVNVEQNGKLVTGLTASNFRVFVDDRAQPFELEPAETPASVVLLVEYSQQASLYAGDIVNAVDGFAKHAPEGNWYALATFDRNLSIVTDFTKQKNSIPVQFSRLPEPFWSEINTCDAIWSMLDTMSRMPGRRIIVFVGSGFDTFSGHSLGDVEKKLESTGITMYGLGAGSALRNYYLGSLDSMELLRARAFLTMLADKTGGEAWFPTFEVAFQDAIQGVMQDIATQYKLVVKTPMPADDRFHKIHVDAFTITNDRRQDFKVRARDGFRQPSSARR